MLQKESFKKMASTNALLRATKQMSLLQQGRLEVKRNWGSCNNKADQSIEQIAPNPQLLSLI